MASLAHIVSDEARCLAPSDWQQIDLPNGPSVAPYHDLSPHWLVLWVAGPKIALARLTMMLPHSGLKDIEGHSASRNRTM